MKMYSLTKCFYVPECNFYYKKAQITSFKKIIAICVLVNHFLISTIFYNKKYFKTNNTANTYISGVIFFALPVARLITT